MPLFRDKRPNESRAEYTSQCMEDSKMKEEFPSNKQRIAVCLNLASKSDFDYTKIGTRGGESKLK